MCKNLTTLKVFLLTCWLLLMVSPFVAPRAALWAQSDVVFDSHRILELPRDASEDVAQQIQTMMGLFQLARQTSDEQSQAIIKELNAEQLQALAEFMNLLPGQSGGQPHDMEALANQVARDPDLRRRAQDILEQFSRDRQLPQFKPGSQAGLPWLPNMKLPNAGDAKDGNPDDVRANRALQERLLREAAGQLGSSRPPSAVPSMSEFLENVRRDPSLLPDISSLPLPDISNGSERISNGSERISKGSERISNGSERGASSGSAASGSSPSQFGSSAERMKEALKTLKTTLPDELEKKLDRNGITKTLNELMQQAKSEVRQGPIDDSEGAGSGLFSGFESALLEAVTEATEGIGKIAKQVKEQAKNNNAGQISGNSSQPGNAASNSPSGSSFAGSPAESSSGSNATESASSLLSSITKPPSSRATNLVQEQTESAAAGSLTVPFEMLLAMVLLVVAGLYFFFAGRQDTKIEQPDISLQILKSMEIRTRQDVIRAFHLLAHRALDPTQHWWTHRRAAATLRIEEPGWNDSLQRLAELYEQARYLPSDESLSDEQLRAAQRAWEHCSA